MINEEQTFKRFGHHNTDLKPKSGKKIVATCDECGEDREIPKYNYRDLCISCAAKKKTFSVSHRKALSDAQTGKHLTDTTKLKISDANRNRPPISGATRQKMCESHTGRHHSSESKQKMSEAQTGRIVSDETRKKLRDAWATRPPTTPSTIRKRAESNTGKRRTEETRNKQSVAAVRRYQDPIEREKSSAVAQGISYDEWEGFAVDYPYCPKFNEACRESNREKYDRRCFLSDMTEDENGQKLSVHHIDMNKAQGCEGHAWKLVPLSKKLHSGSHSATWTARIIYLLEHVWNQSDILTKGA